MKFLRGTFAPKLNGRQHRELAGIWYLTCLGLGMAVIVVEAALSRFGLMTSPVGRVLPFGIAVLIPYLIGTWHWFRWKAAERLGDSGDYTADELRRRRYLGVLTFSIAGLCLAIVFFLTSFTGHF